MSGRSRKLSVGLFWSGLNRPVLLPPDPPAPPSRFKDEKASPPEPSPAPERQLQWKTGEERHDRRINGERRGD